MNHFLRSQKDICVFQVSAWKKNRYCRSDKYFIFSKIEMGFMEILSILYHLSDSIFAQFSQ